MSPNKAPSEGTKVDLGRNAPVKREAAGTVASESLAAESYNEGGSFASNVGVHGENIPSSQQKSSKGSGKADARPHAENLEATHGAASGNKENYAAATKGSDDLPASYDGAAPSYVNNQYVRDTSGPHGKNVQEGFDDSKTRDGLKAALNAEPGSSDDPSRLAEQRFQLNNEARSRAAGPKEGDLTNETKYDALKSDISA